MLYIYRPEICWQFQTTPFPHTKSYRQQMQNQVQKLLRQGKQKGARKKVGLSEWSAPEAEISPHRKTTPVWQAARAIVCDEVFATLGEQNMSAHPSILAGKGTVGQVVLHCHHFYTWTFVAETPSAEFNPHNGNSHSDWHATFLVKNWNNKQA